MKLARIAASFLVALLVAYLTAMKGFVMVNDHFRMESSVAGLMITFAAGIVVFLLLFFGIERGLGKLKP